MSYDYDDKLLDKRLIVALLDGMESQERRIKALLDSAEDADYHAKESIRRAVNYALQEQQVIYDEIKKQAQDNAKKIADSFNITEYLTRWAIIPSASILILLGVLFFIWAILPSREEVRELRQEKAALQQQIDELDAKKFGIIKAEIKTVDNKAYIRIARNDCLSENYFDNNRGKSQLCKIY